MTIGKNSSPQVDSEATKTQINKELQAIDKSISNLKGAVDASSQGKKLSSEHLLNLINQKEEEVEQEGERKKTIIDRIEGGKGIFKFWYVKVPARNLNIGSLAQNQVSINDSVRALSSPICPSCGQGIMMYNKHVHPNANGNVRWFCSNEKECSYSLFAEPSLLKISAHLNTADVRELGRQRWLALTEDDKLELISQHFLKAKLFRGFTVFLFLFFLVMVYMHLVLGALLTFAFILFSGLNSLRWCYRAWQIRTGNLYLEESPFVDWLKGAESYYSLDWLENPDEANEEETKKTTKK